MDQDIAGATDSFALAKIQAQDYRDNLRGIAVREERRAGLYQQQVAAAATATGVVEREAADLLDPRVEVRLAIVAAIAVNYMKPTTGTLPETIANDTANDANRLEAAVTAVERIVWGNSSPTG